MFFPFYIRADLECLLRLQSGALIMSCKSSCKSERGRWEGAEIGQGTPESCSTARRPHGLSCCCAVWLPLDNPHFSPLRFFDPWVSKGKSRLGWLVPWPCQPRTLVLLNTHWQICTSPGVVFELWRAVTGLFSITDGEEVICFICNICQMFVEANLVACLSTLPGDATTEGSYLLLINVGWLINTILSTFCRLQKQKIQVRSRCVLVYHTRF